MYLCVRLRSEARLGSAFEAPPLSLHRGWMCSMERTCLRLTAGLLAAPNTWRSASESTSQGRFQAARPSIALSMHAPPAALCAMIAAASSAPSTCTKVFLDLSADCFGRGTAKLWTLA